MVHKSWNKKGEALVIHPGNGESLRLIISEGGSLLFNGRHQWKIKSAGVWHRCFTITKQNEVVTVITHGHYQRSVPLHLENGNRYTLIHDIQGGFRILDAASDLCVSYPPPKEENPRIKINTNCPHLHLLMGLGMVIYSQILAELKEMKKSMSSIPFNLLDTGKIESDNASA